jgi:pimeloyl-ACP methyl ester carboxylesterase
MRYAYCHGFASSPRSAKARFFQQRLGERGIDLHLFDFNQPSFATLTISREIQTVKDWIKAGPDEPVVLVGSSLGGWVASWVAETEPQVQALILLAPAFDFVAQWWPRLSPAEQQTWQETGVLWIEHYGTGSAQPLHFTFVTDARTYDDQRLTRPVPTLILHGIYDRVIPLQVSQDYARHRPWVKLVSLPSDHALTDCLETLWELSAQFLDAVVPPHHAWDP